MLNRRDVLAGVVGIGAVKVLSGPSLVQAATASSAGPVASTEYGKVRGVSANGVLCFRGVPYGGPVDGARRFLPPTKPAAWKQVRDSVKAGPRAVQVGNPAFGKMSIFDAPIIGSYFSGGRKDAAAIASEDINENCWNDRAEEIAAVIMLQQFDLEVQDDFEKSIRQAIID
jgi:hypothetical protein